MRNIIINGAARTGKTTLSRMIRKKYPIYQTLSGDSLRNAFNVTFFTGKNLTDDEVGKTKEYKALLKNYYNISVIENQDLRWILDQVDLTPEEALHFGEDKPVIFFLGYAGVTVNDVVNNYKKYDTEDDWTYGLPDEKLYPIAKMFLEKSNFCKKECEKYNIKYVDVFENRDEKFKELLDWVEQEMKKKIKKNNFDIQ